MFLQIETKIGTIIAINLVFLQIETKYLNLSRKIKKLARFLLNYGFRKKTYIKLRKTQKTICKITKNAKVDKINQKS
jgi:hypothetical protein